MIAFASASLSLRYATSGIAPVAKNCFLSTPPSAVASKSLLGPNPSLNADVPCAGAAPAQRAAG